MIEFLIGAFFKSALTLLCLLFVNRFLKFDFNIVNHIEAAAGRISDWFHAHHLGLKNNLIAAGGFLALALFVNWYAELDSPILNGLGEGALDLFRIESWDGAFSAADNAGGLMIYAIMVVALNRFFKLNIGVVDYADRWLCDFLDRLILSHGGILDLVSKYAMTLALAMMVNHYGRIGFTPLTLITDKTVAALGLEGMGEAAEARRAQKRCQRDKAMFETRAKLLTNAMLAAEAEGRTTAAIGFRDKLDALNEKAIECR